MSNLVVETIHGAVRGALRGEVAVWRGIPFAAPPGGKMRFLPPQPPAAWTGERDATRFAPVAVQARDPRAAMMSGVGGKIGVSEDCLALNVYSPAADGRRRPVMVWLHGGAFIMGSGSTPLYDGSSFAARHDLVVVTLNYRLGILGLLYLGDLAGEAYAAGNPALLDQIAALIWVRENIARFGGDPDAVTVMGQSAGAISIACLLAAPAAQGLFHRAILQSGGAGPVIPSRSGATALAREVLAGLGTDPGRPEELADVPTDRLLAVQEEISLRRGVNAFTPCVDGVTLPEPPLRVVRAGGARVPLLLGSNRDEWTLFDTFVGQAATRTAQGQLRTRMAGAIDTIHAVYASGRGDGSPERAWSDLIGDVAFQLPVLRLAEAQSAAGQPVWLYRFDWSTSAFDGRLGATHALELPFVWNALELEFAQILLGGETEAARPLTTHMHDTWAAFIRGGDPNGAGLPAWPRFDESRRATMILDRHPRVEDDPDAVRRTAWSGWR